MRFGYNDSSALPRGTTVQRLNWYDLPLQTIKHNVSVTDEVAFQGMHGFVHENFMDAEIQ